MRKVFLSLVAVLLCSISSFAQSPFGGGTGTQTDPYLISTPAHFMAIDDLESTSNTYFKLTKNLNLGTYDAESNDFVINKTFSGTFDGNDSTITYQGSFTANSQGQEIGLFKTNSGTITNLNLDANITISGSGKEVKIGLLCGANTGTIQFCDVTGNVNSTVKSGGTGNGSTGLIIGSNLGDLKYTTGHGNVTGIGYVGGLVGSMGVIALQNNTTGTPLIRGCYFTGSVTANNSSSLKFNIAGVNVDFQSFAGGICGFIADPSEISMCVAEAIIVTGVHGAGIANSLLVPALGFDNTTIDDNYCTGTVNNSPITSSNMVNVEDYAIFSNPSGYNDNYCDTDNLEQRASNLNDLRTNEEKNIFYFAVINGKIVLVVGQQPTEPETPIVCESPINLTVTAGENGAFTASWEMDTEDEDATFTFYCTLTNEDENFVQQTGETGDMELNGYLPASTNPYTLTIKTKCSNELYSEEVSYSFYVYADCTPVANLQVTNIQPTTAKVTWEGEISEISLGEVSYAIPESENILLLEGLVPSTEYTLTVVKDCPENSQNETITTTITFKTHSIGFETVKSGNFNDPNTWNGGVVPDQNQTAYMTINAGHTVTVNHNLVLKNNYNFVANNGILQITQQGQLIDNTNSNYKVPGIVEIVSEQKTINTWTFIGAPFAGYKFGSIKPVSGSDIAMVEWIYSQGKWNTDWAAVRDIIGAGEGAFAWPFYGGVVTFSTHDFGYNTGYSNTASADYTLNKGEVKVKKTLPTGDERWMALTNPYPAKLSVSQFLTENNDKVQGGDIYIFNGTSFDLPSNDTIMMTQGFFVNCTGTNDEVVFNQTQLSYNKPQTNLKASANELIELTLVNGKDKVRVYFAHNEEAEQGYDIFDANKMFSSDVAEPYFVTEGIALIKEEVAELPYYATMNVRSQEDTVMNFVLTNLPEGYAVSIIDGEEVIDMVEGGVYSTEILTGENADRFKVLVKKNVGIADVEELDVTITNNNRQVNITADKAVRTEVYNILGQKVFETHNTTFVLDNVASGAYVVKVYGASASKTQKIVVE